MFHGKTSADVEVFVCCERNYTTKIAGEQLAYTCSNRCRWYGAQLKPMVFLPKPHVFIDLHIHQLLGYLETIDRKKKYLAWSIIIIIYKLQNRIMQSTGPLQGGISERWLEVQSHSISLTFPTLIQEIGTHLAMHNSHNRKSNWCSLLVERIEWQPQFFHHTAGQGVRTYSSRMWMGYGAPPERLVLRNLAVLCYSQAFYSKHRSQIFYSPSLGVCSQTSAHVYRVVLFTQLVSRRQTSLPRKKSSLQPSTVDAVQVN